MIPKNLIQIWIGDSKPTIIQTCQDEVKRFYPDWNYIEINDPEPYLNDTYHEQLTPAIIKKQWDRLADVKRPVTLRVDFIKLLALLKHGGMFLDADMFPLKRIPDDVFDIEHRIFGYVNDAFLIGEHFICAEKDDHYLKGVAVSFTKSPIRYGVASIMLSHWIPEYRLLHEVWEHTTTITHYRCCKPEHRYDCNPDAFFSHLWYSDYTYDVERLRALQAVSVEAVDE